MKRFDSNLWRPCVLLTGVVAALLPAPVFAQPDVLVGGVGEGGGEPVGMVTYGVVSGIRAYAVGTTSCNAGSSVLQWTDCANPANPVCQAHPVIAQNLFRLHNGRIEHIGQAWLKHGFCALSESWCAGDDGFPYAACSPTNCDTLGLGCSDPYVSGLNGGINNNGGPKSDVNAYTGDFQYPVPFLPSGNATIRGRLQVHESDLSTTNFPGARFFVEGHYVAADDHVAGNGRNNASYRRVAFSGATFAPSFPDGGDSTVREKPAIYAWRDDPVNGDPNVVIKTIALQDDGLFYIAYLVTDNGDGTWDYEYAIHNLYSHRSAWSFSVPVPPGVSITNQGFHDVDYHSGEPHSNTDWSMAVGGGAVTWSSEAYTGPAPGGNELTANALRWGTLYNFRFTANTGPVNGNATLSLFRPGVASDPTPLVLVPDAAPDVCLTVLGDANADGVADGADVSEFAEQVGGPGSPCVDLVAPDGVGFEDVCDFVNNILGVQVQTCP